jgi:NAD/NADP transhydrogenase beta subunit
MNRDILNVIFGGLNTAPAAKKDGVKKDHVEASIDSVANLLCDSKEVLCVPGYGMAMSAAQGSMGALATLLRDNGISMKFGIHPVAGRMPGQMNVLLAEARVPHDWVFEMDEINDDMEKYDVVLVLGANDVVNSAAEEDPDCPIAGMPVIKVWKAKKVIFCKRSMAAGYADMENPVFYKENTEMLLGDGKKTADGLVSKVRESLESRA